MTLVGAMIVIGAGASASLTPPSLPIPRPSIIWDDDCGSDLDCVYSLEAIHRQIALGRISVLAIILDSPNPYGAPVMRAWADLWHHPSIPIGVYRGRTGRTGADSAWSRAVRDKFRPGDTGRRYPDCVRVYRRALGSAADASVHLIETGFPTCLVALMQSPGDVRDERTGAQLLRAKVSALFLMGGDYPGPATEYNFKTAATESNFLFRRWTKKAGFPPIYLNGFAPGSRVTVSAGVRSPAALALAKAQKTAGEWARPTWDLMSIHQGTGSLKAYAISGPGYNRVQPRTGLNVWWRTKSGNHYVVNGLTGFDYSSPLESLIAGSP